MIRSILTVYLTALLFSCNNPGKNETKQPPVQDTTNKAVTAQEPVRFTAPKIELYMLDGDSVLVPPFEIEVPLSPKAKERIVSKNETIIIAIFLEGKPKDPATAHFEEDGSFFVGSATREISYGQTARFDNLKFPKKIYDQLADKDVDLTVNIYTGRKTSPDNLITGDFLSDKISKIINRKFSLKQKLIYGDN